LRYEDESLVVALGAVLPGQFVQCQVRVISAQVAFKPRRVLQVLVEDDLTQASLRLFYFNEALRQRFVPGAQIRVLGQARRTPSGVEFIHPKIRWGWQSDEQRSVAGLVSIYPTTQGLAQHVIGRYIAQALSTATPLEWLPPDVLKRLHLPELPVAIAQLHKPLPHAHAASDLERLERRADAHGATLVTTLKDWQRLPEGWGGRVVALPLVLDAKVVAEIASAALARLRARRAGTT